MRSSTLIPCALACFLCACHSANKQTAGNSAPSAGGKSPRTFVQGKATVLEVHNSLGYALLNIDGNQVYGYWESDPATAQPGSISSNGAWGSAVGEGKDPIVHHQDLPAKPGDTIVFRGFKTGSDIYLSGVQVVPH